MNLDCLQTYPRSDLFYKLNPIPTTEAATLEIWMRFDPNTSALLYEWKSGEDNKRDRNTPRPRDEKLISLSREEDGNSRRSALRLRDEKLILLRRRGYDAPSQEILHEEKLGIQDGHWHHLALVFQDSRIVIYKDGNLFADKELQLPEPLRMERCGPMMWGAMRPDKVCLMHAARVWGRALSESEILTSMRSRSAPGIAGLVFDSHLTDGVMTNLITGEQIPVTGTVRANHPYFMQAQAGDNDYLIEDLDVTLTQDMLPAGQDVSIFADTITLSTPLVLNGSNLSVFARLLTVNSGASIDLSGAAGASQSGQAARGADATTLGATGGTGTNGAAGGNGQNGGNLSLWVGTLNGQLPVTSNGGHGGEGQDGGPGGAGAQGSLGDDAGGWSGDGTCGPCNDPTPSGQGGTGGTGGDGGRNGNGGNGGVVSLIFCTPPRPNQDGVNVAAGPGHPLSQLGIPGAAGAPGPGGLGGRSYEQHCDSQGYCFCVLSDDRAGSGSVGNPGSAGQFADLPQPGVPGTSTVTQGQAAYSIVQATFPLPLAHRVLHKAELSYFNSDFATAATLLSWLNQAVPTGDGTSTDEWTCFGARVETLINQMQKGLNYYGMPSNHVPLADVTTYLSTLEGLIEAGANVEADYNFFTDKNNDQKSRIAKIQNQLNGLNASIAQLQAAITTASDLEGRTNDEIAELNQQVLAQYDVLLNADVAFQNALLGKAGCAIFNDFLTAVKGIAALSKGDWTSIGGTGIAIMGMFGGSTLPGIVQQIPTITYTDTDPNSMPAIRTTWNSLQPVINPPAPAPAAPDAGKMAITLEEFDELMGPYLTSTAAVKYLLAMHTYVGLTQAYNQKILTFDALVVKIAQLKATIALKQAEFNRVSALLANTANQDPNLADYVAYMSGVYQDMLTLILRYLFEANAALDYYTLNQTPIQVGTAGQPLSMADISNTFATINTALPDFINGTNGPKQAFDKLLVTISPAPEGSFPGSGGDPFAAFIQGSAQGNDVIHTLRFSVPLAPNPLPGLYQLVGTSFSISVPGFKTTNLSLMIRLTHSGSARFLDATGNHVEFSHTSEEVFYSYVIDSHGNETKTGGGSLGDDSTNPNYIGLSPCTAWTLEIRASENQALDLSAVS